MIPQLGQLLAFPNPRLAVRGGRLDGLVAVGGDLSTERLLLAYRLGIFPWSEEPLTWWSPDPRGIIELDQFHVPRSLRRTLARAPFEVTVDRCFRGVMEGCATPSRSRGRTWITPGFIEAYVELHRLGHAHSVECWREGILVGGVYGVALRGLFAGESMFHRARDASKVALYHLVGLLRQGGCRLFDIQQVTPVTRRFGAAAISREAYLGRLAEAMQAERSFKVPGNPGTTAAP